MNFADVTVIVPPRERLSSTVASLERLFATLPPQVPVIVVEGGAPPPVRAALAGLQGRRAFQHLAYDAILLPNQARNIGVRHCTTPFVVFCDNDVLGEPGWLEALLAHAVEHDVEGVAPLTCIGPPFGEIVHQAGGDLVVEAGSAGWRVTEQHRHAGLSAAQLQAMDVPRTTEIIEFHCVLLRRAFLDRVGPLDERLITRDHMDLALRAKAVGARFGFEPRSVVTYMALTRFERADLDYHLFRWSRSLANQALDAFETQWGADAHREALMKNWIDPHRRRAVRLCWPMLHRLLGNRLFERLVCARLERAAEQRVADQARTVPLQSAPPLELPAGFMAGLAARPAP